MVTLGLTYSCVGGLLLLVTLLVGSSLGVVGSLLLLVQGLPLLTEDLANITCRIVREAGSEVGVDGGSTYRT